MNIGFIGLFRPLFNKTFPTMKKKPAAHQCAAGSQTVKKGTDRRKKEKCMFPISAPCLKGRGPRVSVTRGYFKGKNAAKGRILIEFFLLSANSPSRHVKRKKIRSFCLMQNPLHSFFFLYPNKTFVLPGTPMGTTSGRVDEIGTLFCSSASVSKSFLL